MSDWNFTQEHVVIVGDGSLFDDSVAQLLIHRSNLPVSRAVYSDDLAFVNIIERERPDVILVCESGSLDAARILDLVSSHLIVIALYIVIVRLDNNVIDIYERPSSIEGKTSYKPRRIVARTGNDLIKAVRRKHNE